jgi:hypothetical protein
MGGAGQGAAGVFVVACHLDPVSQKHVEKRPRYDPVSYQKIRDRHFSLLGSLGTGLSHGHGTFSSLQNMRDNTMSVLQPCKADMVLEVPEALGETR